MGAGCAALFVALPASAEETHIVRIPATSLNEAIKLLSAQTRSSIALATPALGDLRVSRVSGRMSTGQALRRMLTRLPVDIVAIDASTFRLRSATVRPERPRQIAVRAVREPRARPKAPRPTDRAAVADIVVTAAKRDVGARRFPGSLQIVTGADLAFSESVGTEALGRAVTSLNMTHLGSGRDKLFLRAVGDSSFSGHSQATVGQYFGEARLNYSGPDPDLRPYDVKNVQLLMGPQGTLYGAGSLGGIIRIEPNLPDLDKFGARVTGSLSATRSGGPGTEIAAMANLPLRPGSAGLRVMGYRVRDGGYIDDVGRAARNSNALSVTGGRAMIAFAPNQDWRIDLSAVGQDIEARDAAYADRRLAPLSRTSAIAQPYSNRFRLLSTTLKRSGDTEAVVSLSRSYSRLSEISDASEPLPDKISLTRRDAALVTALDGRLSRSDPQALAWLVGASVIESRTKSRSSLAYREGQSADARASVSIQEQTLYGEASESLGPMLVTVGGRVSHRSSKGEISTSSRDESTFELRNQGWRFLPAVSLFVDLPSDTGLFLRYAQSYRPPTVAVTPDDARLLAGDRYAAWEFGMRLMPREGRTVTGSLSFSRGRWRNVQADVLNETGYLTAMNIGDAKLATLEADIRWMLMPTVQLDAGMTLNHASVRNDRPSTIILPESSLPNVPDVNAQIALRLSSPEHARHPFRISARLRYVGRSKFGIGPILGREQGDFPELDVEASVDVHAVRLFVAAKNLLGSNGNRFAFGSIAQPNLDELYVPQAPRALRLGISMDLP